MSDNRLLSSSCSTEEPLGSWLLLSLVEQMLSTSAVLATTDGDWDDDCIETSSWPCCGGEFPGSHETPFSIGVPFSFDRQSLSLSISVPAVDDGFDEDGMRIGLPSAVTAKVVVSGRRTRPLAICFIAGTEGLESGGGSNVTGLGASTTNWSEGEGVVLRLAASTLLSGVTGADS